MKKNKVDCQKEIIDISLWNDLNNKYISTIIEMRNENNQNFERIIGKVDEFVKKLDNMAEYLQESAERMKTDRIAFEQKTEEYDIRYKERQKNIDFLLQKLWSMKAEEDLPFPIKNYKELRKMSSEELDIYKIEQMANIEFIYYKIGILKY